MNVSIIILTTFIHASIERCYDVSRSVELHLLSTQHTGERVVAGRQSGLFEEGEEVTWEARHFGILQQLTVRITAMDRPHYFADRMVKGAFKSMFHEHFFRSAAEGCEMEDRFNYEVPFGVLGALFDAVILKRYMRRFLIVRNEAIKRAAEGEGWKVLLQHA